MNSSTQRVLRDPEGELVAPLSGPSYGPYSVIKRKWPNRCPRSPPTQSLTVRQSPRGWTVACTRQIARGRLIIGRFTTISAELLANS
jgi:hypothetical protein